MPNYQLRRHPRAEAEFIEIWMEEFAKGKADRVREIYEDLEQIAQLHPERGEVVSNHRHAPLRYLDRPPLRVSYIAFKTTTPPVVLIMGVERLPEDPLP